MKNYNVSSIQPLLASAKKINIVIPQVSIDSVAAGLSLALSLRRQGVDATVYSPQKTDNNYSKLSGLELLTDTYKNNNLVVSLDYPTAQIDKVSYNDDGGRLNLVVELKDGAPQITNNQIIVQNQAGQSDLNIMLGDETALGSNASIVDHGTWILISPQTTPKSWAKASLIDPDAPFCEIFTFLLPMLGLQLDPDSGKNLLIGLRVATQSFGVNVSPETFEAGAICLRATQLPETPVSAPTPIENVETAPQSKFQSGTNQPNPTPTI